MSTSTDDSLLIPELLTSSRLIEILRQRCVRVKNETLSGLCKDDLVVLFHKHVSPLPQRPCRDNRRGSKIKENRLKKQEAEQKVSTETTQNAQLLPSGSGTRLKPPPKTEIAFERKIIKLKPISAKNNSSTVDMEVTPTILLKRKTTQPMETVNKKKRHVIWP